jgi:hypothetical protein
LNIAAGGKECLLLNMAAERTSQTKTQGEIALQCFIKTNCEHNNNGACECPDVCPNLKLKNIIILEKPVSKLSIPVNGVSGRRIA